MAPRFLLVALALLFGNSTFAYSNQAQEGGQHRCTSGYYEGTAVSTQAGELKVSLNLRCEGGQYSGELVTPVGTYALTSGQWQDTKLVLQFANGEDKGQLDAEVTGDEVRGKFVFGDDSGPFEVRRVSDRKQLGYDKPTLNLTAAQWREDLRYFGEEVPKQHANAFYHLSKEEFARQVARANSEMEHANGDAAYVAMDRIANAIGDGHTFVNLLDDQADFPLAVRLFDGQYRVSGVLPGNERALGARIVKIDDMTLSEVVERLRPLTPAAETKTLGDIRIEDFLTCGLLLHGTGVIPERDVATYTLAEDSGKEFSLTLHSMTMDQLMMVDWIRPYAHRPLHSEVRHEQFWCEYLDKARTLYCNFRGYQGLDQNADRMFAAVKEHHPNKLVIDMRGNLGGDFNVGKKYLIDPIRALPEINRSGRLFVLISAYTFSAGMSNAAQFRSETKATLVGQTIGERPNSYQEAREIRLPNSHLVVRVSTKFYTFSSSQENLIRPDKEIPVTWTDYKAGRDTVLEWVEAN